MATTAPYRIVLLAADADWRDEVAGRLERSLREVVERAGAADVEVALPADDPARSPPQTVVVFLADAASRDDDALLEQVEAARRQAIPVLPVVHPGADVFATLPDLLRPLNAVEWERDGTRVVGHVLRLLGLTERERKLFLSYRRHEASGLALQLREHLSRRAFDVFLDRFSVPPADDFQRRLDIELADKAFVLLLESPSAVGSQWVQHEVAYALSHGIALLALTLPETQEDEQFPSVDAAFRMRLWPPNYADGEVGDLRPADDPVGTDDRVLTDPALERVLDEIEDRYARQLRRRRVALLGTLERWLDEAGTSPQPLQDEWALAADGPGVYLITPRAPTPADLQRLDTLRETHPAAEQDEAVEGCIVFAAPVQDRDDERLIAWIAHGRPLGTHPHVGMPDRLGLA